MKKIVILIVASLMLLASASVCIYCGVSSRNIPSEYAFIRRTGINRMLNFSFRNDRWNRIGYRMFR